MNLLPTLLPTALWLRRAFPLPMLVPVALWLLSRRKKQNLSITSSARATPGTDNPSTASDRGFDVFINFRGPDSRHTVANVLYKSLTRAGLRVFIDDEAMRHGEVIEGELCRAITNSKVYIPIFSKGYAASKWCLLELAKMIDCWEASSGYAKKVILPIFYDVDVSEDVKLKSKVYTTALQNHKDRFGEAVVKPWKDALRKVATIKGWNLEDHGLTDLADLIKKEVFNKLTTSEAATSLSDSLVGIDKLVGDIMELLEEGSPDVRFIVIHGMGGIGKTTLADAVFKKISSRFQGSCFIKDVRRSISDHDMVKLQEKLLKDTLNLNFINISDINDGIDIVSKRLRDQNVLIVLDDVDERDHLLKLAAKSFWFGPKSRIIITTRNIEFLPTNNKEYCFYAMKEMDYDHALQLFSQHAFEKDVPPPEFNHMSTEIVATTGGLPLSLQVIGSSLYNQDEGVWKFRLEKLKEAPHKDVQETLMISYQALEGEQQQIFLDIACIFHDGEKTDLFYFWEACKLYPESSIKILERRSFIKVKDHILWMHDQLRDFGRAIAQPIKPCLESRFPTKPSRLWSPEYALNALQKQEVDQNVIAVVLGAVNADYCFIPEQFAQAINLKYLQLKGGNFEGDFNNVFQQLIFLSWFNCPLRFKATNLNFKNLVLLRLSMSLVDEDWGGWDAFMESKQLKVLHLQECKRLKTIPNFSSLMQLEGLVLRGCSELEEIDISKLKHLKFLEITSPNTGFWKSLPPMPARQQLLKGSIGDLKSLEMLTIYNVGLTELHPSIGELMHLWRLILVCPQLTSLPDSIGNLRLLKELDLSYSGIKELPDSIGGLKNLHVLRLVHSLIEKLPDTIGGLESLKELNLFGTRVTLLPETIGNLKELKTIYVSYSDIKMLPRALVKLENLELLDAISCKQMDGNLPEEIGKLSRLKILQLQDTTLSRVPATINQLSCLKFLMLTGIREPQELLKLPTSLERLCVKLSSLDPHQVPDLSYLTNLVELILSYETSKDSQWTLSPPVQTLQMKWLARLSKLKALTLFLPDPISPPIELSSLSSLHMLGITCLSPQSLSHLPSSLTALCLKNVMSPIEWDHLSILNKLSRLSFIECCLKEIKFDYCLERLQMLGLRDCTFLERLSNLSCLKELHYLELWDCSNLIDMECLGELKSLRVLRLIGCASIQRLPDLSRLKKLVFLFFKDCDSLESIPNVADTEEAPCVLTLFNCKNFRDFCGRYSNYHFTTKHEGLGEGTGSLSEAVSMAR